MAERYVEQCDADYPHMPHEHRAGSGQWARCRGIRIDPAMRAQRPKARYVVVDELRHIKSRIGILVSTWNVTAKVYDGSTYPRARRLDEYPENDWAEWEGLAHEAGVLAQHLLDTNRYAKARAREVRAHNKGQENS